MTVDKSYFVEPETRITNEATGGQKGAKLTQVGSLDPVALYEVARVAGMGANKYSAFNYLKGTDWSLMFNAMQRHALRFWAGETNDPESGLSHMAHVAWMAQALVSFSLRGLGNDDRPPAVPDIAIALGVGYPTAEPAEDIEHDMETVRQEQVPGYERRFMCGHYVGDEPIPYGQDNNCGTELHWGPFAGRLVNGAVLE